MSQARLPRTEPSTELITAHKVNTATLMPPVQTRDFSALPKHRGAAPGGRHATRGARRRARRGARSAGRDASCTDAVFYIGWPNQYGRSCADYSRRGKASAEAVSSPTAGCQCIHTCSFRMLSIHHE